MRCPSCKETNLDKVIDSRMTDGGKIIRRRRLCMGCNRRYTTRERIEEETRLTVIKKDGSRMPFDSERLLKGMSNACYKRPIPHEVLVKLCEAIEEDLMSQYEREVPSRHIGACVARRLRELDQVAYVRFASVYHEFSNLNDMLVEIEQVRETIPTDLPGQQSLFD